MGKTYSSNDYNTASDADRLEVGPDETLADGRTEHDGGSPEMESDEVLDGGEETGETPAVVGRRNEDLPLEVRKPL